MIEDDYVTMEVCPEEINGRQYVVVYLDGVKNLAIKPEITKRVAEMIIDCGELIESGGYIQ